MLQTRFASSLYIENALIPKNKHSVCSRLRCQEFSLFLSKPPILAFLQDGTFEHSGLVDTLSEGAERPIRSTRGSPGV